MDVFAGISPDRAPEAEAGLIVCFSHLRWDFVYQRPQHLLTRAARNHRVLFLEEPVFGAVAVPAMKAEERSGVTICVPLLPEGLDPDEANAVQRDLLDELLDGYTAGHRIAWYYTPLALEFSRHFRPDVTVFDNMDELSAFHGASPRMANLEAELLRRADVVFTGGASLYSAKKRRHANVHCLPSSVDTAHFRRARHTLTEPEDQAALAGPKIGFFGVIDERMDIALLGQVAALRPQWTFVMIGPVVKIDPRTLPAAPNIHWLGIKKYDELPAYLAGWDVAIMPFALNESTRFISPTKTPEYLAAGVRVVSTPIVDVVQPYGELSLVGIAADAPDFVAAVERALNAEADDWLTRVDARLSTLSWDRTWTEMEAAIRAAAPQGKPARALQMMDGILV